MPRGHRSGRRPARGRARRVAQSAGADIPARRGRARPPRGRVPGRVAGGSARRRGDPRPRAGIDPALRLGAPRADRRDDLAQRSDALLSVYDRALAAGADRERRVALLSEAAQVAKDFVAAGSWPSPTAESCSRWSPATAGRPCSNACWSGTNAGAELVALARDACRWCRRPRTRAARAHRAGRAESACRSVGGAGLAARSARREGDHERCSAALEQILALDRRLPRRAWARAARSKRRTTPPARRQSALAAVEAALKFALAALAQGAAAQAAAARRAPRVTRAPRSTRSRRRCRSTRRPRGRGLVPPPLREQKLPTQLIDGLAAAAAATRRTASAGARCCAPRSPASPTPRSATHGAIAAYQRAWREPRASRHAAAHLICASTSCWRERPIARPSGCRCSPAWPSWRPGRARSARRWARARAWPRCWARSAPLSPPGGDCLELDRADAEALATLPACSRPAGRWSEYVEILRHRMSRPPTARAKPRTSRARRLPSATAGRSRRRRSSASQSTSGVRAFGRGDRRAGRSLTEEKRWPELHDPAGRDLPPRDRARAARLAARLGDACRLRLDDPAHAVDWYESALVADPRHTAAREGLEALPPARGDGETTRARRRGAAGRQPRDRRLGAAPRSAGAAAGRRRPPGPRARRSCARRPELCETRAADKRTALAHTAQRAGRGSVRPRPRRPGCAPGRRRPADFRVAGPRAGGGGARRRPGAPPRDGAVDRRRPACTRRSWATPPRRSTACRARAARRAGPPRAALCGRPLRRPRRRALGRSGRGAAVARGHATTSARRHCSRSPRRRPRADGGAAYLPLARRWARPPPALGGAICPDAFLRARGRIAAWHENERDDYRRAPRPRWCARSGHGPEHLPTLHRLADLQRRRRRRRCTDAAPDRGAGDRTIWTRSTRRPSGRAIWRCPTTPAWTLPARCSIAPRGYPLRARGRPRAASAARRRAWRWRSTR